MNELQGGAGHPAPRHLVQMGWNEDVAAAFERVADAMDVPARVIAVHRNRVVTATEAGECDATLDPRLLAAAAAERPSTGDWVALRQEPSGISARVRAVVPRRTAFIRRAAGGKAVAQVVAANVDRVLVVTAVPHDVNERRLERYLALAWESGALPTVVVTKCDLVADVDAYMTRIRSVAPGVDVIAVSALRDDGVAALRSLIGTGTTIALLGSSGVGKSTLVNRLAGHELMRTAPVDGDGRGRHTTTHRELMRLGNGVLVIDTPGMREMQLWSADAGLELVFDDISSLGASCRFGDCHHEREPGCAVNEAVAQGALSPERLASWRKLGREVARAQRASDAVASTAERAKLRAFMRSVRAQARTRNDR